MGINLLLKKEGLDNIQKLDTLQINKIASYIADKLCKSFPELHLSQSALFIQISRLNMYLATMPDGSSAKYVYGNNSIYFNENLDLSNMDITAIHECIHYLQEYKDQKGKLTKLGLYDLTQETGLAINEAAVQLLASRTSRTSTFDTVTYYGMSFVSESPEYYPLECALLSQMMFFTGDEPLYFSTLYGSPMFKRAFINSSNENTFYEIENLFDKLLNIETDLIGLSQRLQSISFDKSKILQMQIESKKKSITNLCLKIQNKIIENCFKRKFMKVETFDDIRDFENDLREFQDLLIISDNYDFYIKFCDKMAQDIAFKKNQIIKYGKVIDIPKEYSNYLPVVTTTKKISKLQEIITTLKDFIWGE